MAQVTVKLVLLVPLPPGVTTVMWPVVAPFGTVAVICAYEFTLNFARLPLNSTVAAPVNAVPEMVTTVPAGPDFGEQPVTVGLTMKLAGLQAVPTGVVTEIGPVRAPSGTFAVIFVSETNVKDAATLSNLTDMAVPKSQPRMVTV